MPIDFSESMKFTGDFFEGGSEIAKSSIRWLCFFWIAIDTRVVDPLAFFLPPWVWMELVFHQEYAQRLFFSFEQCYVHPSFLLNIYSLRAKERKFFGQSVGPRVIFLATEKKKKLSFLLFL